MLKIFRSHKSAYIERHLKMFELLNGGSYGEQEIIWAVVRDYFEMIQSEKIKNRLMDVFNEAKESPPALVAG